IPDSSFGALQEEMAMHFPNHIRSDRNSRRLRPCLQPARTYRWRPALEPLENRLLLNDTPVGILSNEPHLAVNPLNPANVVVSDVNNLAISTDAGTSFSLPIAA